MSLKVLEMASELTNIIHWLFQAKLQSPEHRKGHLRHANFKIYPGENAPGPPRNSQFQRW